MRQTLNLIKVALLFSFFSVGIPNFTYSSPSLAGNDTVLIATLDQLIHQMENLTTQIQRLSTEVNELREMGPQFLHQLNQIYGGIEQFAQGFTQLLPYASDIAQSADSLAQSGKAMVEWAGKYYLITSEYLPQFEEIMKSASAALGYLGAIAEFIDQHPVALAVGVPVVLLSISILSEITVQNVFIFDAKKNIVVQLTKFFWNKMKYYCGANSCTRADEIFVFGDLQGTTN
jgi:uncharacterized protein YoxC